MLFKRRIDHPLSVMEIEEELIQGVTFPIRCRLSEDIDAVVKYPRNRSGPNILINEWVGNSIADIIGLTIPRYGLCYLTEGVINDTNHLEEIDCRNQGVCFFSCFLSNTAPANRRVLSKAGNRETERLILFDYLIRNEDRHDGNILYEVSENHKVYYIDCSHIMVPRTYNLNDPNDMVWELSDEAILDNHPLLNKKDNMYNLLCETMGYREDVLFSEMNNIKELITVDCLKEIRKSIPEEWINELTKKRIKDMFIIIEKRLSRIEDIAEMIAEERRKSQWKKY